MSKINNTSKNLINTIKLIKSDVAASLNCKVLNSQITIDFCNGYLSVMFENKEFRFDYIVNQFSDGYIFYLERIHDFNE